MRGVNRFTQSLIPLVGIAIMIALSSARAQPFPDISSWPTSFQTAAFVGIAIGYIVVVILGRRSKLNTPADGDELQDLRAQLRDARLRDEIIVRAEVLIAKLNLDERFKELEIDRDHHYAELDQRIRTIEKQAAARWRIKPEE